MERRTLLKSSALAPLALALPGVASASSKGVNYEPIRLAQKRLNEELRVLFNTNAVAQNYILILTRGVEKKLKKVAHPLRSGCLAHSLFLYGGFYYCSKRRILLSQSDVNPVDGIVHDKSPGALGVGFEDLEHIALNPDEYGNGRSVLLPDKEALLNDPVYLKDLVDVGADIILPVLA